MKIAFISFEYPPDTAFGGIATYVHQIAKALSSRGIEVYVFTASITSSKTLVSIIEDVTIIRVPCEERKKFKYAILEEFEKFQKKVGFDIIESPEYGADGLEIKNRFKDIPLVVKLHMPWYFIKKLNNPNSERKIKEKIKKLLHIKQYKKENDPEYQIAQIADSICSPSISLADIVSKDWQIKRDRIHHLPNPYIASNSLLDISIEATNKVVTYTGRLEMRKGIVNLIEAIIKIVSVRDDIKFRLIGKAEKHSSGMKMTDFIKLKLGNSIKFVEIISHVNNDELISYLASTNICVYPSIWENFPNTCLEAMAAGRGIVASMEGGMKDMLNDIQGGVLINPKNPDEISIAIQYLIDNPIERINMAKKSRQKIVEYYGDKLVDNIISYYKNTIRKCQN
jgi:glycogen(starch) synthase